MIRRAAMSTGSKASNLLKWLRTGPAHAAASLAVRHWAVSLGAAWAVLLALVGFSPVGTYVDANLTWPAAFRIREALGRDPALAPELKILSLDDGSLDRLQRPDLTLDDWALLLENLAQAKPRLILIDKIFALLFDPLGKRDEALRRLDALDVPVFVGAYATPQAIKSRPLLNLSAPRYQASTYRREPAARQTVDAFRGWFVYGPHPDFAAVIAGAGHIGYYDDGVVSLAVAPSEDTFVPHLALAAAEDVAVDGQRISVGGHPVPADANGSVLVNFSRRGAYYERHKRLGTALIRAREGKPAEHVAQGDVVLILPEMYTGSTDFKPTPIGTIPGGFVLASMVNSALTGGWLARATPLWTGAQILLVAAIGAFWGYRRKPRFFWSGLVGIALAVTLLEAWLFTYESYAASTPLHLLGVLGTALIGFAGRTFQRDREARRIATELSDAAEMAATFLPEAPPAWPGISIKALHRSISQGSGDWYAFRASPSGRFRHAVLVDVTGHGVQAALMVAICKTVLGAKLRDAPESVESPTFLADYADALNAMLHQFGGGRYVLTMLGLTFDAVAQEVRFLTAGHPPPILLSQRRDIETGDRRGRIPGTSAGGLRLLAMRASPLGLAAETKAKMSAIKVVAGDEILAYTDGLPLGQNVRVLREYLGVGGGKPFELGPAELQKVIWSAEKERTGRERDDDISVVWFRVDDWAQGTGTSTSTSTSTST
jgi:CHASE2 domain-containing sensor protein